MTSGQATTARERLLFFTGPAGAGKSSTAAAWVASRLTPTALIEADAILGAVRLGQGPAVHAPETRAARAVIAYYKLCGKICAAMARTYLGAGFDCVINQLRGFAPPPEWDGQWDDLDGLDPFFVVLFPRLEVCLERTRARTNMTPDEVAVSYGYGWDAWSGHPRAVVLDTSDMALHEVVDAVGRLVD